MSISARGGCLQLPIPGMQGRAPVRGTSASSHGKCPTQRGGSLHGQSVTNRPKHKIDDGFFPELVEGACLFGYMGIPGLMDLGNTEVPSRLVPFCKASYEAKAGRTGGYVHFYQFDETFSSIITDIDSHIELLSQFDGVITPDCTLLSRQSNCLQAANTYFNRAVGFRLQKAGIPVICQIRWSDARSFDYCFLGVPRHSIVAISSYGTVGSRKKRRGFRRGLVVMLKELEPDDVIVHGPMPEAVFAGLSDRTRFHHFDDWITSKHRRGEVHNGSW